jgi:hypothetical protein
MATRREIERAMKRMSKKRAGVVAPLDRKPQISGEAAIKLKRYLEDLRNYHLRCLRRSGIK